MGWLSASLALGACGGEPPCSLDNPCGLGSFCDAGVCRSECEPGGSDCPVGVCTADGRCARQLPDPAAGVCAAMVLEARFGTPTVMLLVDRSLSMNFSYSGGTRWDVLRDALIDPTDGVVTNLQSEVRFGLAMYTSAGGTCPALDIVPPALNNRDAIADVYEAASPGGGTPTGEALEQVTPELTDFPEPGPKYLIVATDGEPNTCAQPTAGGGQDVAVAAAQSAHDAGITLYFLSVGSGEISEGHMQDMANAGVGYEIGGPVNAPFYEAGDADQLAAAFDAITSRFLSCDLEVNGVIDPEVSQEGVIYLDGHRLTQGAPHGWEPLGERSFRLLGDACARAERAGAHTITAEFPCAPQGAPTGLTAHGGGIGGGCAGAASGWVAALCAGALLSRHRRRRSLR